MKNTEIMKAINAVFLYFSGVDGCDNCPAKDEKKPCPFSLCPSDWRIKEIENNFLDTDDKS